MALPAETSLQGPVALGLSGQCLQPWDQRGSGWPGLKQPLIPSLPDQPVPARRWLCPHCVLSFAFQSLAGLSPGLTEASGSAPAAAPEREQPLAAPGQLGSLNRRAPRSSVPVRACPWPGAKSSGFQQPRGAAGARNVPPLQLPRLGVTPAAAGTPGRTGAARADPSGGISPGTATGPSVPGLCPVSLQTRGLCPGASRAPRGLAGTRSSRPAPLREAACTERGWRRRPSSPGPAP